MLKRLNNFMNEVNVSVYHGSDKYFNKFKLSGTGVHFGTYEASKEIIDKKKRRSKENKDYYMYSVQLSNLNPIKLDDGTWYSPGYIAKQLQRSYGIKPKKTDKIFGKFYYSYEDIWKVLVENGYNSIMYENENEDVGSISYVIFDLSQIRIKDINKLEEKLLIRKQTKKIIDSLNEVWFSEVGGVDIYKNPDSTDIKDIRDSFRTSMRYENVFRFAIILDTKDVYIWNGNSLDHDVILKDFGINKLNRLRGIYYQDEKEMAFVLTQGFAPEFQTSHIEEIFEIFYDSTIPSLFRLGKHKKITSIERGDEYDKEFDSTLITELVLSF